MTVVITPENANDPKWFPNLETQVGKQWATPRTQMTRPGNHRGINVDHHLFGTTTTKKDKANIEEQVAIQTGTQNAKLNPRWVETLMGLPIGWTMPSCASPVTIAPMNCDCLETELFQLQQNELLES